MTDVTGFTFDEFPGRKLVACVVCACTYGDTLRTEVASGILPVAVLDARLLATPFCLHAAGHRVLHSLIVLHKSRSPSLHADLVCALLGARAVGDSLRVLGAPVGCKDVLLAAFDPPPMLIETVVSRLRGSGAMPLEKYYPGGTNLSAVMAAYRISPLEISDQSIEGSASLEASVLGRIALQDTASS